jgi:hypothetical protein
MKKLIILFFSFLLLISTVLAVDSKNIIFDGTWQEGSTLYSQTYTVTKAILYGVDVSGKFTVHYENHKPITNELGCSNPYSPYNAFANSPNVLSLINFKYSVNNGDTWNDIPYGRKQITLKNTQVMFKLDIPTQCDNIFKYNKSVYLVKY